MSKRFAMTGVGGYVAPRHLQAIQANSGVLVAACDPADSVGIMDRYFFDVRFFTEYERFDRHLEKLRRRDEGIDYLTVCSPNYLHDAHIRLALRLGADAICEKPLVINPWNLDALAELESETGHRVHTVLQLRVHPAIVALREKILAAPPRERPVVDLTYITSRGRWYQVSWKGDEERSGGLVTNIGIHFFDMLMWIFGDVQSSHVHHYERDRAAGFIQLERADVRWLLSIDRNELPSETAAAGQTTYRSITIDGQEIEFSGGFTDLHTRIYEEVVQGRGFGIEDARPSIELVHGIRTAPTAPAGENAHPLLAARTG